MLAHLSSKKHGTHEVVLALAGIATTSTRSASTSVLMFAMVGSVPSFFFSLWSNHCLLPHPLDKIRQIRAESQISALLCGLLGGP